MRAILLIFQIGTVQSLNCNFLKYEQKIILKQITSSEHTKFAQFWVVFVRKCMVKKFLISYRFVIFSFFSPFFDNSVRAFSWFLFWTEWSEMSLYCYHHKMVEMEYWKVQIHVLTDFNPNLNLIHYLSHNFQRCLGKLKVKA